MDKIVEIQQSQINDTILKNISTQATLQEAKQGVAETKIEDIIKDNDGSKLSSWTVKDLFEGAAVNNLGYIEQNSYGGHRYSADVGSQTNGYQTRTEGGKVLYATNEVKDKAIDLFENSSFKDFEKVNNDSDATLKDIFTSKEFLEGISKDGSSVLKDSSAMYSQILKTLGIDSKDIDKNSAAVKEALQSVANTLVENKDAVLANIEALEAQKAATEALNESYLKTLGEETDVKDTETYANIASTNMDENSLNYLTDDAKKKYNFGKDLTFSS